MKSKICNTIIIMEKRTYLIYVTRMFMRTADTNTRSCARTYLRKNKLPSKIAISYRLSKYNETPIQQQFEKFLKMFVKIGTRNI